MADVGTLSVTASVKDTSANSIVVPTFADQTDSSATEYGYLTVLAGNGAAAAAIDLAATNPALTGATCVVIRNNGDGDVTLTFDDTDGNTPTVRIPAGRFCVLPDVVVGTAVGLEADAGTEECTLFWFGT